jgi:hypothetical protein
MVQVDSLTGKVVPTFTVGIKLSDKTTAFNWAPLDACNSERRFLLRAGCEILCLALRLAAMRDSRLAELEHKRRYRRLQWPADGHLCRRGEAQL